MVTSSIKLSPAAYAEYKAKRHNGRKKGTEIAVGGQDSVSNKILGQTKKAAELASVASDINNKFEEQQESDKKGAPLIQILSSINSNPKQIQAKEKITKTFNEIQLSNWIGELTQDYRFKDKKAELEKIRKSTRKIDFRQRIDEITKSIKDTIKEKFPSSLRFVDVAGIELYDPNFVLVGKMARNKQNFIKEYRGKESYIPRITENTISTMTTIEVRDYLNELHYGLDQSESLVMMMMDGTTIPDHVILADWLDSKGYNIRDDIIVLPANLLSEGKERFTEANWEEGTPSPYYPLIERLYCEVGYLFERAGLIKHSDERGVSYDNIIYELSDFVCGDSGVIPNKFALDTLKEKIREGLDAKQIDLKENKLTQAKKDLILGEIFPLIDDFDKKTQSYWNWFKLFTEGDDSEKFIREKHINTDFLLELVFSNNLLPQLQYKSDLIRLFFGDEKDSIRLLSHDNPNLASLLTMKFFVSRWSENDFEAFSQRVRFRTEIEVTPQSLKQAKRVIINKIDEYIKSRGYIADEFTRYGVKYSQKDILPEFNFVNAMFDFANELEYFNQLNEKMISKIEITQSFRNIKRLFGIGVELLNNLRKGLFFSPETVEKIMSSVQRKLQEDFGYLYMLSDDSFQDGLITDYEYQLLDLYSNFLSKAGGYANQRGLNLFAPDEASILNRYDLEKWTDERVKGYGVVFHLCQFLGFDPLFFEPLDKGIFKNGKFARQHFRDWIYRKSSSRVSDTLLTDRGKHPSYEQYSEGFIVALMNGLIEAIQLKKEKVTPADLENSLKIHMTKYLSDQGGTTLEGNSIGELVNKVWGIWNQNGQDKFKEMLDELNKRRTKYIDKKGIFRYDVFLEKEYDMDSESRFVKNARDFHTLLRNNQISGSARDLYVTQHDFDYMQRIFPESGSTQSRITDWIFIFSTLPSRNINIEWVDYLEKQVWKI